MSSRTAATHDQSEAPGAAIAVACARACVSSSMQRHLSFNSAVLPRQRSSWRSAAPTDFGIQDQNSTGISRAA